MVLIFFFLIANGIGYLLMYLFAIFISSLLNVSSCLFPLSNRIICFLNKLLLSLENSLYILNISPFSNMWLADIFSCSVSLSFYLFT